MKLLVLLQEATPAQGGGLSLIFMMVAVFAIMYFLMIRPQQKRQKELALFRNHLKRGDKVITAGGIYGIVDEVAERYILLIVDKDFKIKVDKGSIVKDTTDIQQPK